jgi:hypothetical protein
MGVRGCDRKDCIEILCDLYSNKYGYICDECFEELINTGAETNIETFMKSNKINIKEAEARYSAVFKIPIHNY